MYFDKVTSKDIDLIAKLQPEGWSDITAEFRFFLSSNFCNPVKMIVDNKIVGVGSAVIFNNTAWLAHIIVGGKHRNRGFGSKIVEQLLNDLNRNSIQTVSLIASPFGEPVYKKFGFRTVSDYIYLERKKRWIEKKGSKNITPYKTEFYPEIIRLDREISGEERAPLLMKHIESSFVYLENEKISGFFIPTLGEGPIFATTPNSGVELMHMKYATSDTAVLPANNKIGLDFLVQNGFSPSETRGKRMILGKEIHWQPTKIFSRISGDYG